MIVPWEIVPWEVAAGEVAMDLTGKCAFDGFLIFDVVEMVGCVCGRIDAYRQGWGYV